MKIKDFEKIDLPREKLEKYGPEKLADHELLGILLGSGIRGLNVLELSKNILQLIQGINRRDLNLERLLEVKGLGKAKATQVLALLELSDRLLLQNQHAVLSPDDVWKLCDTMRDSQKEHFVAFYLNAQGNLIEKQLISLGTLTESLVHPREVFEPAVSLHSASVIVAHNHPSGEAAPSDADTLVTTKLKESGKILGIPLEDHVIVTKKNYFSFRQQGLL